MHIRSIYKTMYIYFFNVIQSKENNNDIVYIYNMCVCVISNIKLLSLLLSSLSYVTAIPLPGRHPDHLESIFGILQVP